MVVSDNKKQALARKLYEAYYTGAQSVSYEGRSLTFQSSEQIREKYNELASVLDLDTIPVAKPSTIHTSFSDDL